MIDTHAHIYLPEFDHDRAQMIQRAKSAGVSKILLPAIDSEVINEMLRLAETEKGYCLPMMGLHPCSVKNEFEKELSIVTEYLNNPEYDFIAV
ncbi:MAG: TatD family hydrolase, partial [Chitinophagales bacterium]